VKGKVLNRSSLIIYCYSELRGAQRRGGDEESKEDDQGWLTAG